MSDIADTVKFNIWRWLGSLFMEPKLDPTGQEVPALSLTRVLSLFVFGTMVWMWVTAPEATDPIPSSLLHTFWTLLGLKGVNKVVEAVRTTRLVIK